MDAMRILFVEDSQLVAKVVKYLFEHSQSTFDVVHCVTLNETRQQLAAGNHFDFALVDLNLPDAPDGEVVGVTLGKDIPTIVLSSSIDNEKRKSLLQQGVVDYVLKETRYAYEYAVKLIGRLHKNNAVTILIAEDSTTYRRQIRRNLENYQYHVVEAADGLEALTILRENDQIKMLITDFEMPNMNGLELIRAVRKEFEDRELRIIGLSANESGALSIKFIKNGANDYLRKPFDYEELHCRVWQNIEQAELLEQIRNAAYHDFLTQLHNRRHLMEKVAIELQKNATTCCVAMMDLDHFKHINDNWGHDCGDYVLKTIGKMLNHYFVRFIPARVGGEEFCVVLEGLLLHQSEQLMQRFCQQVEEATFEFTGQVIPVTISIGLTSKDDDDSLAELMKRADDALYIAKEQGRNQVAVL